MDDIVEEHAPAPDPAQAAPVPAEPPGDATQAGSPPEMTVHWSEVQTKTAAKARMPDAARTLPPGEYTCQVRIHIDITGTPTSVEPLECPEVFQTSAVEVGMAYRFYPVHAPRSAPVPVKFDLRVVYRISDPSDAREKRSRR